MNTLNYQLKTRQVCLFFIAFLPILKYFTYPSTIAYIAQEDLWLSTILNVILDLISLFAIISFCHKTNGNIYKTLEYNFGKVIAKTIMIFYLLFFLTKSIIPICEQKEYIQISLYETPPTILAFLPVFILSVYICLKNIRVWGRASDIIWIFGGLAFILLFVLSLNSTDFTAILPIGARGIDKVISGSYKSFVWFNDSIYLLFFAGEFNYRKKDGIKITISFLVAEIMVILFVIIFYGIFSSITFRQLYGLTEISRYSMVINNIARFDFVAIFLILFVGTFSLTLPVYFAVQIVKYLFNLKKSLIPAIIINGVIAIIVFYFSEYQTSIKNFIFNYANGFFMIFGSILPIFTLLLKKEKKNEISDF